MHNTITLLKDQIKRSTLYFCFLLLSGVAFILLGFILRASFGLKPNDFNPDLILTTILFMIVFANVIFFKSSFNYYIHLGYTRKQFYMAKLLQNVIVGEVVTLLLMVYFVISIGIEISSIALVIKYLNFWELIQAYIAILAIYLFATSVLIFIFATLKRFKLFSILIFYIFMQLSGRIFLTVSNYLIDANVYPFNMLANLLPSSELPSFYGVIVLIVYIIITNLLTYKFMVTSEFN